MSYDSRESARGSRLQVTTLLDETVDILERVGQVFVGVNDLLNFLDRPGDGGPRESRSP